MTWRPAGGLRPGDRRRSQAIRLCRSRCCGLDRRAARGCPRLRWRDCRGSWNAAHCPTAGRTSTWALLRRHGWSWQQPACRAIERDGAAVGLWKKDM
ncbi:winged helix-turn-helix domain-containing protein [Streptomyces canus]